MQVIGITGGLGTGKSTAIEVFKKRGVPVFDADSLVHGLLKKGQAAYDEVIEEFGEDILHDTGEIHRKKLAECIFANEERRSRLEAILHPRVKEALLMTINSLQVVSRPPPALFVEVPLLFEAGWEDIFDEIWVISASEETQRQRLAKRGMGREDRERRIQAQMPLKEKERRAHAVIDNEGTEEELEEKLLSRWRRIAGKLALIAHDQKKEDMIQLAREFQENLATFSLISTGNTGNLLEKRLKLEVERVASGPLGGDQQVGGQVAEGRILGVIFLRDPLTAQPHEPDISALMRVCDVHQVPLATNRATARMLLKGIFRQE